jgi:hypothetical protein
MTLTKKRKRLLALFFGTPVALISLAALAHSPLGRPLLSIVGASGARIGCPVSAANASPARLEAQRRETTSALRGDAVVDARARPALAWMLVATTKSDVAAWASSNGIACTSELSNTALRCRDVHDAAFGAVPIRDLFLRFDAQGALVGVDAMHEGTSGDEASHAFAKVSARVSAEAGAPKATQGDATAASLEGATYASATAVYRFRNYAADVSVTNFGADGIVVREQYRALD